MTKTIFILSFMFFSFFTSVNGEEKDSIIYYLPDSVEIIINDYLQSWEYDTIKFECIMKQDGKLYELIVCQYNDKNYISENTNRYVIINNRRIPVYFDYDIEFWLKEEQVKNLGEFGNRFGGLLPKRKILFHCFSIKFNRLGNNIKVSYN